MRRIRLLAAGSAFALGFLGAHLAVAGPGKQDVPPLVSICHVPSNRILNVPPSMWAAHLDHGDYFLEAVEGGWRAGDPCPTR